MNLAKMNFTRQQSDCKLHISMEWNQGELPAAPGPPAAPAARPGPLPANAAQFPLSRNRKWAEVAAEEAEHATEHLATLRAQAPVAVSAVTLQQLSLNTQAEISPCFLAAPPFSNFLGRLEGLCGWHSGAHAIAEAPRPTTARVLTV